MGQMNDRLLIERLSAEIEKASAAGDHARARKLADLQLEVLARLMRDVTAEPLDAWQQLDTGKVAAR
jgi:hypothetical protein